MTDYNIKKSKNDTPVKIDHITFILFSSPLLVIHKNTSKITYVSVCVSVCLFTCVFVPIYFLYPCIGGCGDFFLPPPQKKIETPSQKKVFLGTPQKLFGTLLNKSFLGAQKKFLGPPQKCFFWNRRNDHNFDCNFDHIFDRNFTHNFNLNFDLNFEGN